MQQQTGTLEGRYNLPTSLNLPIYSTFRLPPVTNHWLETNQCTGLGKKEQGGAKRFGE
jgi:hypothetical protein